MNIDIIYKENENIWQYVKVCNRCRKQFATVTKDDRKPVENEIDICKSCAFEMFSNEQTREYYWILPKQKLPTEGQEVEFVAKYIAKRRRFQGHFQKNPRRSQRVCFLRPFNRMGSRILNRRSRMLEAKSPNAGGKEIMKRPPKKWLCNKAPKTPEEMDVPELKKLLDICNKMQALCGWNEETYNQ